MYFIEPKVYFHLKSTPMWDNEQSVGSNNNFSMGYEVVHGVGHRQQRPLTPTDPKCPSR